MTIDSAIPETLATPSLPPSAPLDSAGSLDPAASRSGASAGGAAPSRPVRRLVALACALALSAGAGACSITLDSAGGGSTSSREAAEAASDGASSTPEASASQTPTARRTDVSSPPSVPSTTPSPSDSPTALPPLPSADPSRPGAGVTITSSDWVTTQQDKDMTMTPNNGQVVVDRSFQNIVIEGDVTDLTVNSDHVDVVVDYAQNVVVNGTGVHVYVRDTTSVTVTGTFNTVLWAGNTPQIQDLGNYNKIKNQAEDD